MGRLNIAEDPIPPDDREWLNARAVQLHEQDDSLSREEAYAAAANELIGFRNSHPAFIQNLRYPVADQPAPVCGDPFHRHNGPCELYAKQIVDQPAPIPNDGPGIWSLVIADMQERDKTGFERYGTRLQAGNGRDALVDAYLEALDLVVYLRQAIEERNHG